MFGVTARLIAISLLLTGCVSNLPQYTPDGWQLVASYNDVDIQVRYNQRQLNTVLLEQYDVRYVNRSSSTWCVLPHWRLMDFDNNTYQSFVALGPHQTAHVGSITQRPWQLQNAAIVLPASGYVDTVTMKKVPQSDDGTINCVDFLE